MLLEVAIMLRAIHTDRMGFNEGRSSQEKLRLHLHLGISTLWPHWLSTLWVLNSPGEPLDYVLSRGRSGNCLTSRFGLLGRNTNSSARQTSMKLEARLASLAALWPRPGHISPLGVKGWGCSDTGRAVFNLNLAHN